MFYDVPRFKSIILKKLNRRTAHFLAALHFGLMTPIPLKRMTSLKYDNLSYIEAVKSGYAVIERLAY